MIGPFANWLLTSLSEVDSTMTDMAREYHLTRRKVYEICASKKPPKFSDVVCYCWYLNHTKPDHFQLDPLVIWQHVCEEFHINPEPTGC